LIILAAVAAYLIGSIPTASFLAQLRDIDLRREGSGNPGTNNALRTGGPVLAASVLAVEAAKGYAAVWTAGSIANEWGVVVGGAAAVAGNVFSLWHGFSGGKGLGISLGVLLAAWPGVLPVLVALIAITAVITRSAGLAALTAMLGLVAASITWSTQGWPTGGMAGNGVGLFVLAVGMNAVMGWKHWRDSPLNPAWRSEQRNRV
jgi:glycerol-3-phosphate acyltransferase PlsY